MLPEGIEAVGEVLLVGLIGDSGSGWLGSVTVKEVEVKYRIDTDHTAVTAAVEALGATWSHPVDQDDQAYAPAYWGYGMSKLGVPFARLRTQDGACLFTVKIPRANEMACEEHETLVADRDGMHAALLAMGWVPTVRIVKTRRTAALGDVSLCLDTVEHAGVFLEAETMTTDDDLVVQARLDKFVGSLGVSIERVTDTYDSLVRAATN